MISQLEGKSISVYGFCDLTLNHPINPLLSVLQTHILTITM